MNEKVKVYLCARFGRKGEMRQYANDLRTIGCDVVCRWLDTPHDNDVALNDEQANQSAAMRLDDILAADIVIHFAGGSSGGRHFEFGAAAMAQIMRNWLRNQRARVKIAPFLFHVGKTENVFTRMGCIDRFDNWQACLDHIKKGLERRANQHPSSIYVPGRVDVNPA